MKRILSILTMILITGTALAQWPRPVQTQGRVGTNDPVVFADNTGRYIKTGTNTFATAAQGAKADTALQPGATNAIGGLITTQQWQTAAIGNLSNTVSAALQPDATQAIGGLIITQQWQTVAIANASNTAGTALQPAATNAIGGLITTQQWQTAAIANASNTAGTALQPAATNAIGGIITTQQWQTAAIANASNIARTALQPPSTNGWEVSTHSGFVTNILGTGFSSTTNAGAVTLTIAAGAAQSPLTGNVAGVGYSLANLAVVNVTNMFEFMVGTVTQKIFATSTNWVFVINGTNLFLTP